MRRLYASSLEGRLELLFLVIDHWGRPDQKRVTVSTTAVKLLSDH
jgi:hypothetical protein